MANPGVPLLTSPQNYKVGALGVYPVCLESVAEFNWKNSKPIEQHQLGLRSDRDHAPILRWFTISLNIFLWRGTFLNRVC